MHHRPQVMREPLRRLSPPPPLSGEALQGVPPLVGSVDIPLGEGDSGALRGGV